MEYHLADLFEYAVDHFAEREFLVCDGQRRTYAQMEARANQLAHHLQSIGVRPGDHVGIYAYNSVEWVEIMWAVFKIRAVWININFRYVEDELRYLFTNADLVALIHQPQFADRVAGVLPHLPDLKHVLVIGDDYEAALAAQSPERDFAPRSPDDHYILYTGGTTGMPKGVVWRQEDVFFALGGGLDLPTGERVTSPTGMVERGLRNGPITMLPIAPLMHGATQWGTMQGAFVGNKIVLVPDFDPAEVWRLVGEEQVNVVMITGDAMGRPLVEELDNANYDLSSLIALSSTAAVFSPTVKDAFFERLPNLLISDAVGSSEGGGNGLTYVSKDNTAMSGGGPTINPNADTAVFDESGNRVEPGSGVVGKIARSGSVPIGYYKDPEKTAATFVELEGRRWSIPGDFATVEADGTITLLGRGSVSINSGGEKIYPEEVEAAVKAHPDVWDAVVVGVPDERWGQRVAAVVQPRPNVTPDLESIQEHCRLTLARYKVPRQLNLVDTVVRSPSGKPDYRWALDVATKES
ncbi:MAG TPA: acyl-CoA synthetase [Acidimicrobiales bacterium]|nr:acyl-CoA synthetase [Acidimicrobiales bacterium]